MKATIEIDFDWMGMQERPTASYILRRWLDHHLHKAIGNPVHFSEGTFHVHNVQVKGVVHVGHTEKA